MREKINPTSMHIQILWRLAEPVKTATMVVSGTLNKAPAAELLVDPFRLVSQGSSTRQAIHHFSFFARCILIIHAEGEGQGVSFAVCAII